MFPDLFQWILLLKKMSWLSRWPTYHESSTRHSSKFSFSTSGLSLSLMCMCTTCIWSVWSRVSSFPFFYFFTRGSKCKHSTDMLTHSNRGCRESVNEVTKKINFFNKINFNIPHCFCFSCIVKFTLFFRDILTNTYFTLDFIVPVM